MSGETCFFAFSCFKKAKTGIVPGCSGLFKCLGSKDTDNKISWPLKRDFGHQEVFPTHNAEPVTLRPGTERDNKRAREKLDDQTLLVGRT